MAIVPVKVKRKGSDIAIITLLGEQQQFYILHGIANEATWYRRI